MHSRREIRTVTEERFLALTRAIAELQSRNGSPSLTDLTGSHGIPRRHCRRGSPLFLGLAHGPNPVVRDRAPVDQPRYHSPILELGRQARRRAVASAACRCLGET